MYKLPRLAVLNIRRWPPHTTGFSGCYHKIASNLDLYEVHLQRLTQRIFTKADATAADTSGGRRNRARLAIVAWGPNGRSRVDTSDSFRIKQVSFARGKRVDPFGEEELLAVNVPWKSMSFFRCPEHEARVRD